MILEKFGVKVGSREDSAVLLVEVEAEFQEITVLKAPMPPSSILVSSSTAWRTAGWKLVGDLLMNILTVATMAQVA